MPAKFQSFLPEAQAKVSKFMLDSADAIAKNTERVVKLTFKSFPKPPIDTGNLRRNITSKVLSVSDTEVRAEVRASTPLVTGLKRGKKNSRRKTKSAGGKVVEYAKYIEYGTYKMTPRPFMRNGVTNAIDSNMKIIKRFAKQNK